MTERTLASRAASVVPALPRWVPWASGFTAIALTVLVVALDRNRSFGARLVTEAAGVLIPLLFATAGVSGIAEGFRRREWRRRTQFIAVDGVEEARVALAGLASQLMDIVGPSLPHNDKRRDIRTAFTLPYTQTCDAVFDESHHMALTSSRAAASSGHVQAASPWHHGERTRQHLRFTRAGRCLNSRPR